MMWVECAWFKCRQRFKPGRRSNQSRRAGGAHHEGARYCSRSCQQKAYRLRRDTGSATVTPASEGTTTHATVTRTCQRVENIAEIWTKNGHPRPAYALNRGRSKRALVRILPDGILYRIAWPDIGLSDLCNLTRAKAAALEWAQHKEMKWPAAQRLPLKWSPCAVSVVQGREHGRRLSFRRSLPRVCQAGRGCPARCHKAVALSAARVVQAVRAGGPVWDGADALALRISKPPVVARDLLRAHQETYRTFWRWSDAAVDQRDRFRRQPSCSGCDCRSPC